jgi:hypothetical protein
MQRVRIGLTGLAFVFVLVLLATALVSPSEEALLTANSIEQQRVSGGPAPDNGANAVEPTEPLAELGVAPGKADNAAAPAPGAPQGQGR